MAYYIQHKREESRRQSSISFTQCQHDYYSQWRDDDGSIPWRMFYQPPHQGAEALEIDPVTGDTLR